MRKLLLAVIFASLGAGSVLAADMAARPYTKAPPVIDPVYNWTGFYAGVNVGAVFSRSEFDYIPSNFFAITPGLGPDGTVRFNRTGFTGGGQAGYNWQAGKFVLGVEGDINYTDVRGSGSITRAVAPGLPNGYTVSESSKSDWLATARLRAGITGGNALFYVTGGLAVADYNFTQTSFFPNCPCGVSTSVTGTKAGWTAGGGVEYAFTPAWSVKAEYLYVDLGSASFSDNLAAGGFPAASFTHNTRLTESIGRFGVNYRWGGPVVAKY
ncbi:MAG: outer membrane beta-barrel protein [Bradyrhizobium sp.]